MKKIGLLSAVFFLLWSCVEVKFEEPQPHGVKAFKSIPKNFRGTYLLGDKDTVDITADNFTFSKNKGGKPELHELSDVFVLKKWQNTYFLNFKDEDAENWTVIFISRNKEKKLMLGYLAYNNKDSVALEKLAKLTQLKTIKNDDGEVDGYLIKPSKKELNQIMKEIQLEELGEIRKLEE